MDSGEGEGEGRSAPPAEDEPDEAFVWNTPDDRRESTDRPATDRSSESEESPTGALGRSDRERAARPSGGTSTDSGSADGAPSSLGRASGDGVSDGHGSTTIGPNSGDSRASGGTARPRSGSRTGSGGVAAFVREVLTSALVVVAVGALLFAVSGIWPPMVAIESGSMEPHLQTGDLVFVMEEHRLPGSGTYGDTGVVSAAAGARTGYAKFAEPGDVIVYAPNGDRSETPIIHRARFWVNDSENWYGEADPRYVGDASNCLELRNCPAPHGGFITKGDANPRYDQATGISSPVKPEWITGTAEFRIPWLGEIRLLFGRGLRATTAAAPLGQAVSPGQAVPNAAAS
jgi:signal peptidase